MPKASVIIPVYNVERYIDKCARSLFEQTLDDMEYVFVNDCTRDRSIDVLWEVLEEYPHRKPQVKVFEHEVNQGLPQARRTGISHATGEYIIHCDSDDWVERNMYEYMYLKAVHDDADVVICDFNINDNEIVRSVEETVKKPGDFRIGIMTKTVYCSVWNKLVRKSLYENIILYPTENYAEDMALMAQLIFFANIITYCPIPLYHYRNNPNSISKKRGVEAILRSFRQTCANARLVEQFYQDKPFSRRTKWAIDCMKSNERDRLIIITSNKEYYRMWKNTFPELNHRLLVNPLVSLKRKLRFILVMCRVYPLYAKWRGLAPVDL